jgi:hypothetical protein
VRSFHASTARVICWRVSAGRVPTNAGMGSTPDWLKTASSMRALSCIGAPVYGSDSFRTETRTQLVAFPRRFDPRRPVTRRRIQLRFQGRKASTLVKRGEFRIFEQSFGADTSDDGLTQERCPSVNASLAQRRSFRRGEVGAGARVEMRNEECQVPRQVI